MSVTLCQICDVPIREEEDREGYDKDLCPVHLAERKKERNRHASDDRAEDEKLRQASIEQKEKVFDRQTPAERLSQFGVGTREAEDAVKYYISRPKMMDTLPDLSLRSFYVHGGVGTGKTVIAAASMYRYARRLATGQLARPSGFFRPEKFRFVHVPEFLYEIRSSYRKKFEDESSENSDPVKEAMNSECLVLDDLGAEKFTDWVLSTLYIVVNHRYSKLKPTLFTSNLPLEDLTLRMEDNRIPSRIEFWCETVETSREYLRKPKER
jgi:DNA replication protein DnaC